MKKYTLQELQKMAVDHFNRLQVNKLYATTDGQFFLLKNRAMLHAGKGGTVHAIEAEQALQEEGNTEVAVRPLSVADLKKSLAGKTIEELNQLLEAEEAGSKRKSAIDAITEAIKSISQAAL